nr:hypothetical protein GCM10025730_54170 [Promicromonospora thailandica]
MRAWLDAGKEVVYTSNVTDVDDPLLERATATGVDWRELAASQVALFREDMTALGVVPPRTWTGAVDSVPDVARAVVTMLESGAAYRVPLEAGAGGATPELGDVYADLTADPHFGTVAHLDREQALATFAERGETRTARARRIPSTRCCGGANGPASPRGTAARWAPAAPAGTSSAP